MQPPVFRLWSLPTQLREHVLRFVPLYDKLLQLSHLSHDFPRLTPACFSEDDLELDTVVVRALTRSASLLRLLSRVRHVSVSAKPWLLERRAGASELSQRGWRSLPPLLRSFSRLQSLSVRVERDIAPRGSETAVAVQDLLTVLPALPQLSSLCIEGRMVGGVRTIVPLSDLALLSSRLPSLRSLTLWSMPLTAGSLSLLCSLPLELLDLRGSSLFVNRKPAPPTADVSFSLRRLHLPQARTDEGNHDIRRVLAAYGIDRIGRPDRELRRQAVQLELVDFNRVAADEPELQGLQQLLWCIPSLTALTLTVTQGTSLSPQPASASAGLMLPQLRCVSLVIRDSNKGSDDDGSIANAGDWLSDAAADCASFLRCYSGQLLRLELKELPHLPAAAPILQAAVQCQQLRHLGLQGADGEGATNIFTAASFAPQPQLHTLELRNLVSTRAQLTALLHGCPALEHIELWAIGFRLELLPLIGRCCRGLKVLKARRCGYDLFSQPVQEQLTAAEQADGDADAVFPQLMALTIIVDNRGSVLPPSSPPTRQWLLRLLRSAPALRFLHLDTQLDPAELLSLSSLTALRGFRLFGSWHEWQRRFFCSGQPDRFLPPDPTVWQPVHEADRELQLVSDLRDLGALFRDDEESCHGRTSREDFFAAVEARLAGESGRDGQHRL